MMKTMKILFCVAAVLLSASCIKGPYIRLVTDVNVSVTCEATTVPISFECNNPWTAGTQEGWTVVSSRHGDAGTIDLTVSVAASNDHDPRASTVVITSETVTQKVVITQAARPSVDPDADTVRIACYGGQVTVPVKSNIKYEASISSSWIHLAATKSYERSEVILSADENTSVAPRSSVLTLKGDGVHRNVVLLQDGRPQLFKVTHYCSVFNFPNLEGASVTGTVNWGYESFSSPYTPGLSFTYKASGSHTATFEGSNVSKVSFSDLTDISSIDFSGLQ